VRNQIGGAVTASLAVALLLTACAPLSPEPRSSASIRRAYINGAELTYIEQGAGETVVFLHGSATDYRIWKDVRRRFGDEFRLVAYSRRHHAPNAWPDDGGTHSMTQHAEDLVGLIGALGAKRAHLVAVSMGARVAAHTAVHHPQVVQTLTLSDGLLAPPLTDEGKRAMDELGTGFNTMFGHIRAGNDVTRRGLERAIGDVARLLSRQRAYAFARCARPYPPAAQLRSARHDTGARPYARRERNAACHSRDERGSSRMPSTPRRIRTGCRKPGITGMRRARAKRRGCCWTSFAGIERGDLD